MLRQKPSSPSVREYTTAFNRMGKLMASKPEVGGLLLLLLLLPLLPRPLLRLLLPL